MIEELKNWRDEEFTQPQALSFNSAAGRQVETDGWRE